MHSRADRSPLKSPPLREPGQSIRNAVIDLVFGRLLPVLWLTSLALALTLLAWVQQALGVQISPQTFALITAAPATVGALQFYFVAPKVQALQLGRDGVTRRRAVPGTAAAPARSTRDP
jgi:hypothetical protein